MIVYLGIGSNINAEENITKAKQALLSLFKTARFSRTYESEAVGFKGDNFLNLVAEIEFNDPLFNLIEILKNLENQLGRVREGAKFSSRHIDIDILLFGNTLCQHPIVLPRDEIKHNAYVLWPLSELAGDMQDPSGELTYAQLWQAFDKTLQQLTPVN